MMAEPLAPIATLQSFEIEITVNGGRWKGNVPAEEVLLDFLRYRLKLTGTKRSCESEVCGACIVLVDGKPISSCSYLTFEANGKSVTTIEGVAPGGEVGSAQEESLSSV